MTYGMTSVKNRHLNELMKASKYGIGLCLTSHMYNATKKDMKIISPRHQKIYKE